MPLLTITPGQLAAAAAIVETHGPPQTRQALAGALRAHLAALWPDPEHLTTVHEPNEGEPGGNVR